MRSFFYAHWSLNQIKLIPFSIFWAAVLRGGFVSLGSPASVFSLNTSNHDRSELRISQNDPNVHILLSVGAFGLSQTHRSTLGWCNFWYTKQCCWLTNANVLVYYKRQVLNLTLMNFSIHVTLTSPSLGYCNTVFDAVMLKYYTD